MRLRSFLFAPGNQRRRMEKTLALETDVVVFDLEDAVPNTEKVAARDTVRELLAQPRGDRGAYVRVNALSTSWAFGDFTAVIVRGLDGVILPKAESASDIAIAEYLLSAIERERDLPAGGIDLLPMIETAKGYERMSEIARAAPRVKRMAFGGGDFSNDTSTAWTLDNPLTALCRAQLAIVSRAAGIEAPIDTPWAGFEDEAGLNAECATAAAMGFAGKLAIHPKQLATINRTFSPSDAQIAAAQRICAAFDAAEAGGSAALVVDGAFIDYPLVYRARRLLENAARHGRK